MFTFPVGFFGGSTGAGDPYWNNVALYLPLTGTNGATTFPDVSSNNFTVTRNGDTVISTAQAPVLTGVSSSILLDGSGDFLSLADNNLWDPGSGDYTIEMWFRVADYGGLFSGLYRRQLVANYAGATNGWGIQLRGTAGSYTSMGLGNGDTGVIDAPVSIVLNTWYYFAWVKNGSTNTFYINGSSIGSATLGTFFDGTGSLLVGRVAAVPAWDFPGYISHLRITKGVARYTANFTPPTAPFPIG